MKNLNKKILSRNLKDGKIAVIPTDTIYGLSTSAFLKESIEKIYLIKKRDPKKPLIILLSKISDLALFNIKINTLDKKILKKYWPGKTSIILPCLEEKFHYLHRGQKKLAFRLPKNDLLSEIIKFSGPIVSTSANPEALPPAKTIKEAKEYFGKKIDIYINGGKLENPPSTLIEIKNGELKTLR